MAIDVLKRQGKSAAVGLVGKNLRRIAGNIGSVLRGDTGGDSSEAAAINRTKQSTKMLSFPIDVGADPGIGNHGHYIMFEIMQIDAAELKFGSKDKPSQSGAENMAKAVSDANMPPNIKVATTGIDGRVIHIPEKYGLSGIGSQLQNYSGKKTYVKINI